MGSPYDPPGAQLGGEPPVARSLPVAVIAGLAVFVLSMLLVGALITFAGVGSRLFAASDREMLASVRALPGYLIINFLGLFVCGVAAGLVASRMRVVSWVGPGACVGTLSLLLVIATSLASPGQPPAWQYAALAIIPAGSLAGAARK